MFKEKKRKVLIILDMTSLNPPAKANHICYKPFFEHFEYYATIFLYLKYNAVSLTYL